MPIQRINAWSSPRNISTAFMYSFAQRSDTTVLDEPLYAHYLSRAGHANAGEHPGREDVLRTQINNGERVVKEVLFGDYPTPVVLFKQMTHHLIELDRSFLANMDNILLIRDPRAIIASYAKVIIAPTLLDVGVAMQYELFQDLQTAGTLRAVVDARELLLDPRGVLEQLCDCLQLPFDDHMLHWPAGPRPEDGVWAKHWYAGVHQSTGFLPYEEKKIELPLHLEALAQECLPYYQALYEHALKAPAGK